MYCATYLQRTMEKKKYCALNVLLKSLDDLVIHVVASY